jgi:hypothetical protein
MLPVPPKSSETRAIMLFILHNSEHLHTVAEQITGLETWSFAISTDVLLEVGCLKNPGIPPKKRSANF